jgi:hypothetical protein
MNYEALRGILDDAFEQATGGKGQERHAAGRDFKEQPIIAIPTLLKDDEGVALMFQAIKKLEESLRLPPHMKRNERLGAIIYIAASMMLPACQMDREEPVFQESIKKSRGEGNGDVRQPLDPEIESLLRGGVDIRDEHGIIPPGVNASSPDGGVRARLANQPHMTLSKWIEEGGDSEEWHIHRETRNLHVQTDSS